MEGQRQIVDKFLYNFQKIELFENYVYIKLNPIHWLFWRFQHIQHQLPHSYVINGNDSIS